jgi:transposase
MHRHALTDGQWARLRRVLPVQRTGPRSTLGDRLFIEAVLYRAKTGLPWRDLPERFGPWKSVHNRFANWARKGHFATVFREL